MAAPSDGERVGPVLRVATINVRNTADRWRQRRHLLVGQLAELRADLVGVQEVRRWPSQAGWITRRLNAALGADAPYECLTVGKTGWWGLWEGIAILTRVPVVDRGRLDLGGDHRVGCWVRVRLADGTVLELHNTHLSWRDPELRDRQARRILGHLATKPEVPTVLVGDLNAEPTSATLRLLGERFRSAYAVVHGAEPARTVPTPLRGPSTDGTVIDYVLVDDHVGVHDAWVAFDRPAPTDPTLFPSDHFGVVAVIAVPPSPAPPSAEGG